MIEIRRVLTHVEDIHHEFGPPAAVPLRRGWLAGALATPQAHLRPYARVRRPIWPLDRETSWP